MTLYQERMVQAKRCIHCGASVHEDKRRCFPCNEANNKRIREARWAAGGKRKLR